jgi:hypothetical protein
MRSAIKQVVNAYVRSSLRRSVEQMLVRQRRQIIDSIVPLREVNAETAVDRSGLRD